MNRLARTAKHRVPTIEAFAFRTRLELRGALRWVSPRTEVWLLASGLAFGVGYGMWRAWPGPATGTLAVLAAVALGLGILVALTSLGIFAKFRPDEPGLLWGATTLNVRYRLQPWTLIGVGTAWFLVGGRLRLRREPDGLVLSEDGVDVGRLDLVGEAALERTWDGRTKSA